MSKANALARLIGNYGDSDEEPDEAVSSSSRSYAAVSSTTTVTSSTSAGIHPAPIAHCPWSACYDETSGFTYYWNQITNAVTWDAPPEYLLALKLAQQQLHTSGTTEVSAEEWQLYQQALAEKQNKTKGQAVVTNSKPTKKNEKPVLVKDKKYAKARSKRPHSDDEDEKIELITSYYNSDSESNEEPETPTKPVSIQPPPPQTKPSLPKQSAKKQKVKSTPVEYGPSLPPNQNYSVPIGPEMPPDMIVADTPSAQDSPVDVVENKTAKKEENDDLKDESALLLKLKDKAMLLEKLGGEIPSELRNIIKEETNSRTGSPKLTDDTNKDSKNIDTNIDDLLDEIEKKELPKVKTKTKIDIFGDEECVKSSNNSARNSPRSDERTPPVEEFKPLFPSSKAIVEDEKETPTLFPSAANIQETETEPNIKETLPEKKSSNLYLPDDSESVTISRKKLRISNSVLPDRKNSETPSYTTKYSQHIEGFSSERKGLGFSQDDEVTNENASAKKTVNYGNGLMFTKGEILNEEKKNEDLDNNLDLVDSKLKYLNQLQPSAVTPVQEMLIQLQTLSAAFRSGDLTASYVSRWTAAALATLAEHEARAAPPGWKCIFVRCEGRYQYVRADGYTQWEYPALPTAGNAGTAAAGQCDMDISTTPPHPGIDDKECPPLPPLPGAVSRVVTPPPPRWADPPPPGCHDLPPLPPEPPKQEIGEELQSFYKDIAELEKQVQPPLPPLPPVISHSHTAGNSPEHPAEARDDKVKEKDTKVTKKKSKVKISSSVGLKHKSVSSLVAKWQQVAEEINSD